MTLKLKIKSKVRMVAKKLRMNLKKLKQVDPKRLTKEMKVNLKKTTLLGTKAATQRKSPSSDLYSWPSYL